MTFILFTTGAPNIPIQTSPLDREGSGLVSQNFNWEISLRALTYRIQISILDGEAFENALVMDIGGLTSSSFTIPDDTPLDNLTTYFWRVRAENLEGVSGWSEQWSFTVNDDVSPVPPVLVSPVVGSTEIIANICFIWEATAKSTSWDFQLATDSGFTSIIASDEVISTAYEYVFTSNTTYYWRVRSKNSSADSVWVDSNFVLNAIFAKTPAEISSNILWLRSDMGVTLSTTKVTTWDDQSPSAFHISNSTDANRPTLVPDYFGTKPAIYFNKDVASTINCLGRSDPTGLFKMEGTQIKTIMMFLMQDSTGTALNSIFGRGHTSWGMQWRMAKQAFANMGFNIDNATFPKGSLAADEIAFPIVFDTKPMMAIFVCNLLNVKLYFNETLVANKTVSYNAGIPDAANPILCLGSSYFNNTAQGAGKMHLFQFAVWDKALTELEIKSLNDYRKAYFELS